MSLLCLASLLLCVLCTSTNCVVSALITTQCSKKLLCWRLRISWIYQKGNKKLEDILKLCPFSWVRVIRWPLGSKSSPFVRFEIDYNIRHVFPPSKQTSNSIRKLLITHLACFITVPTSISCLAGHYYSSQVLQLCKTVGFCLLLFSPEMYVIPFYYERNLPKRNCVRTTWILVKTPHGHLLFYKHLTKKV